jgi:hypothetical protein
VWSARPARHRSRDRASRRRRRRRLGGRSERRKRRSGRSAVRWGSDLQLRRVHCPALWPAASDVFRLDAMPIDASVHRHDVPHRWRTQSAVRTRMRERRSPVLGTDRPRIRLHRPMSGLRGRARRLRHAPVAVGHHSLTLDDCGETRRPPKHAPRHERKASFATNIGMRTVFLVALIGTIVVVGCGSNPSAGGGGGSGGSSGGSSSGGGGSGAVGVGASDGSGGSVNGLPDGGSNSDAAAASDATITASTICMANPTADTCPCPTAGAMSACWTGDPVNRNRGLCHDGTTQCVGVGEFKSWGPCQGEVLDCGMPEAAPPPVPEASTCAAGDCIPGSIRYCDDNRFNWSKSVCDAAGKWGPCVNSAPYPGCGGQYQPDSCCVAHHLCCQWEVAKPFVDFGGACTALACTPGTPLPDAGGDARLF